MLKSEVLAFTRKMSLLQDAGLPLLRSLRIVEMDTPEGVMNTALIDVIGDIESGETLSGALAKRYSVFDRAYINMVKAGESAGSMDGIFPRLVEWLEQEDKLSRLIKLPPAEWNVALQNLAVAPIIANIELIRTARLLGMLVGSGVPILESISIVRESCRTETYRSLWKRVFEAIREGDTIAYPLQESGIVSPLAIALIDVGEETGDLDQMLIKVADFYQGEVDRALKS